MKNNKHKYNREGINIIKKIILKKTLVGVITLVCLMFIDPSFFDQHDPSILQA